MWCARRRRMMPGPSATLSDNGAPMIEQTHFGSMPEGATVDLLTMRNAGGIEVRAISLGATIVAIRTPDRVGEFADVVLGFDTLQPYLDQVSYFGVVAGR